MNISQILFSIDALILVGVSAIYFYWAFGGKWGANAVLPQVNSGKRVFTPSSLMPTAVAISFFLMSFIFARAAPGFSFEIIDSYLPILTLILAVIFTVRALGDFKYVGFFKKVVIVDFVKNDSKYFSPFCVFVAISLLTAIYLQ